MDRGKSEAYKNLVERAKKQYTEYRDDLATGNGVKLFASTINGVNVCNEINLYTYWQGFGYAEKTPNIKYLLVAQDFGNFFNASPDYYAQIEKMNETGEWIPAYEEVPEGLGTNDNLFRLFKVLDRDLLKLNDDVFFTNFCLGYRFGKETGGMTKKLMMHDADLFRELCEILEPENILCLGRITSECVYKTLTEEPFKKVFGDSKNYNDFLDNHQQVVITYGNGKTSKFYPLAHCGYMGTMNRNRGYNLPEIKADILFKQREDWQKIIK